MENNLLENSLRLANKLFFGEQTNIIKDETLKQQQQQQSNEEKDTNTTENSNDNFIKNALQLAHRLFYKSKTEPIYEYEDKTPVPYNKIDNNESELDNNNTDIDNNEIHNNDNNNTDIDGKNNNRRHIGFHSRHSFLRRGYLRSLGSCDRRQGTGRRRNRGQGGKDLRLSVVTDDS